MKARQRTAMLVSHRQPKVSAGLGHLHLMRQDELEKPPIMDIRWDKNRYGHLSDEDIDRILATED